MSFASSQRAVQYELVDGRPLEALPPEAAPPSLIDLVLASTVPASVSGGSAAKAASQESAALLDQFLALQSADDALRFYLRHSPQQAAPLDAEQAMRLLARDIARIDALLSTQVDAILHAPQFQRVEAAWRGLRYLVDQSEEDAEIEIRVLNVSKRELMRDLDKALEFDQSQLFKKVYENEFGMPGGKPYGLLVGDYEFGPEAEDVEMLRRISGVAATAFAPFIAGTSPTMLGLDHFGMMEQATNLAATFEQLEYLKWHAFRESDDSRFVGLTLPRTLGRLPYDDDCSRNDRFRFREDVGGPGREKYLWMNAAFAFAAVVVRSFASSGWMADIRGVERGVERGGLVTGLPVHHFATDKAGIASKFSTDVVITDLQESMLSSLGFIPLCQCRDTEFLAFCTVGSIQKAKKFATAEATTNARISAMLQYVLCVSRFAHYLKAISRDKIGSFAEPEECELFLHNWLQQYVTDDVSAQSEVKAEKPLRKAEVEVRRHPSKPGSYLGTLRLWPHFELDELVGTLTVRTELRTTEK
jgi:type VI secretion system ImpC/EvpB family protein